MSEDTSSRWLTWRGSAEHPHAPLRWRKPRLVRVVPDMFDNDHTDEMIDRFFSVMVLADWHTYQVITKRSKRMREYVERFTVAKRFQIVRDLIPFVPRTSRAFEMVPLGELRPPRVGPLPNVWLGVPAENQPQADERIPDLLATPAAVRFVDLDPLLGPIDLRDYLGCSHQKTEGGDIVCGKCHHVNVDPTGLDWVRVGGESGPGARPCDVSWIRSIKDECRDAGVPVFVKQLGSRPYSETDWISHRGCAVPMRDGFYRLNDPRGGNPGEWPEDLRVRQMPEVAR